MTLLGRRELLLERLGVGACGSDPGAAEVLTHPALESRRTGGAAPETGKE